MKIRCSFYTIFLMLAIYHIGYSQSPCDRMIELSKQALNERDYELGIRRLLDANSGPECASRRSEINQLIQEAFNLVEGERQTADSLAKRLASALIKSDSFQIESRRRLDNLLKFYHARVIGLLKEFQSKIYTLEFNVAEQPLKTATEFGVGIEEVLEGYAELIFFYAEAGKAKKAYLLYEKANNLGHGGYSLPNTDTLNFLSGVVKQWVDSITYDKIYYRYYPRMVSIKGGEFKYQKGGYNEKTGNWDLSGIDTTIYSFSLAQTETTFWQYLLFVSAVDSIMPVKPGWGYKGDNPVVNVSWYDACNYAEWLSKKKGIPYRLPKEIEWEFAARGGNKSQGYIYAGSNNVDDVAWHYGKEIWRTSSVSSLKANELGLYDMSGNVVEWCQNLYSLSNTYRVIRGCSWNEYSENCRITNRINGSPNGEGYSLGFRLVFTPISDK